MLGYKPFIEMETNGTITPKGKLFTYIDLFNCSPKLSNSGEELKRRYKPDTLNFLNLTRSIFKFVVSRQEDMQEILSIIDKCNIFPNKVYLMPSASDINELKDNTPEVVELCLKHGFNFSTRLQIIIWNKTTGV
jgi:organic radical activating enzyme